MKKEEGLGTKIWLEEQENLPEEKTSPALHLYYKFSISKAGKSALTAYAKSKKIKPEEIVCAAWGLLLNKLSTTDNVLFGFASINVKPKSLNLVGHIKPIMCVINNELKAAKLIQAIKAQKITLHGKKAEQTNEIRYLLATKSKSSAKSALNLDARRYSLCLIYDKKAADQFVLAYHPHYFHKNVMTTIANYFERLILQLCNHPDAYVVDMDVMSDKERKKVTEEWPHPKYTFTVPKLAQSVSDLIAEFALRRPDKLAISHLAEQISFKELNHAVEKTAHYLLEKGIKPQENVAVLMDRTPSLIIVMLAIFKIGA